MLTGVGVFESVGSRCESAVDDWEDVFIEVGGRVQLLHILCRVEVIVGADNSICTTR